MNDVKNLLVVYGGVLVLNATLSAAVWARQPTPLNRALFGFWACAMVNAVANGLVQSDRWMVFAFALGAFATMAMLADIVARVLGLRMRWRLYGAALLAGLILSVLALAANAAFWVRALPAAVAASTALVDVGVQALQLRRQTLSTSALATLFSMLLLTIHCLDYPFLRDNPRLAPIGFIIGILIAFAISISAPAVVLEHTAREVGRLNEQLQQRVTEALAALQTRDDLITIAAHEIRAPINALHLAVEGLQRGAIPAPEQPKMFAIIERSNRRLKRFVDELLDIGHIQSGTLELKLGQVDLTALAQKIADDVHLELAQSGSELRVAAARLIIVDGCDSSRLAQVLNNLLTNAIKFGQGKPIELSLSAQAGRARLLVTDHGVGIPAELHERIFEPFGRGVSVRHYGGLGLGLHIARTLVMAMGGTLTVDSTPGTGSTFAVTLPLAKG